MAVAIQPSGTVTLLFSDIEGSTRLLERLGTETYAEVLEQHRRLLREVFARRDGYEVDTEGDAFFVTFARAGDAVAAKQVDQVIPVSGADAMKMSKQLAQKEGIFVGTSAGATFTAALQVAKEAPDGSVILCMLPDTGERYLSTPLFGDILAEMNEEEAAIAASV